MGWMGNHRFYCSRKMLTLQVEMLLKATLEQVRSAGRSNITYDADGLGSFLIGYLAGARPFNNGSRPLGGT